MNAENGREFVDTNILIYAYDAGAGEKHEVARTLLEAIWRSRLGCLSVQVLQEFYVTVTQKVGAPYSADEAAQIIRDLGSWRVHAPAAIDVLTAIDVQQRHRLSFWDAMIVHSAGSLGCSVIWSEDLNHGQTIDQVTVRNPFR